MNSFFIIKICVIMFLLGILPLLIVGIADLKKPKINKIKKDDSKEVIKDE